MYFFLNINIKLLFDKKLKTDNADNVTQFK
jgi:hypothetical protein